jgi:YegS/Rv2252/BmrU family lipid kinase
MDASSAASKATQVPVIVNAHSGGGHDEAWAQRLTELFETQGIQVSVILVKDGDEIAETVQRAIRETSSGMVIAGGGDGTINTIAAQILDKDIRLGVLPMGTLNHFAKDLRIPLELDAAVRTIAEAHTTHVDVGEVNGRIFLNNSSIGLYALMVRQRDREQRSGLGKWPAMVKASWKIMNAHRARKMRLLVDGREIECRTPLVFIGNNTYVLSGFDIGERKTLDGGVLSLYIVPRDRRWSLIWLAIRALFGRLHQDTDFQATTAEDIIIEARRNSMNVATDGEVELLDMPLQYRIRKRALRVIVPADSL